MPWKRREFMDYRAVKTNSNGYDFYDRKEISSQYHLVCPSPFRAIIGFEKLT